MVSNTKRVKRVKSKSKRRYNGGSGGSTQSKKTKSDNKLIPVYLQQIDHDKLVIGEGYYFDIGKDIYYGTYRGGLTFTDTYNITPIIGEKGIPIYDKPYHGVVEAKKKIYKIALHPRGLPSELRHSIGAFASSKPGQSQQSQSQLQTENYFGPQPSYP